MTRKDYVLIASAIKQTINNEAWDEENGAYSEVAEEVFKALVSTLGYKLLLDNPRFHQAKFEEACGF